MPEAIRRMSVTGSWRRGPAAIGAAVVTTGDQALCQDSAQYSTTPSVGTIDTSPPKTKGFSSFENIRDDISVLLYNEDDEPDRRPLPQLSPSTSPKTSRPTEETLEWLDFVT